MKLSKKQTSGFTLIETLISIILLAIVLAGGMAFYFNSSEIMGLVTHKKIALETANSAMEDWKITNYGSLPDPCPLLPDPDTIRDVSCDQSSTIQVGGLSAAKTTTFIDQPQISGPADYKEVRVDVAWTEAGKSTPRNIHFVTYIAP